MSLPLFTGLFLIAFGLPLTGGGAWLLALGGSWFYLFAGLALLASGLLLAFHRFAGVWVFVAFFVVSLIWALAEVGLGGGWALVPRLVGTIVMFVLVIASIPFLDSTSGGRRLATTLSLALAALVIIGGWLVFDASRLPPAGDAPHALAIDMTDPSPLDVGADWPAYGGSEAARRYSPLEEITAENVASLERAWEYRTGDLPEDRWGAETTPLKIGDALFLCSARNIVISLDAATGAERWRYDPKVDDDYIPYTAACRGVSYYEAPAPQETCQARVFVATLDARLIAVDAASGRPCPGFGDGGEVDTTLGMGDAGAGMISTTSPPAIVRGVVVVGHQILDGQYTDAPSGVVLGYDALTGDLRWAWDLARPELDGLPPEGDEFTRGTPNMWTMASGDEELGLVYMPLGNSAGDYWSSDRLATENEYSTSLVALDVETGKPRWHFRTVHVDVWDYDLGAQASLVDFPTDQGAVPALILPTKQGDMYVLDRRTGEPLIPVDERAVPQGGVEPEMRSPTQPFSRYHTLAKDDLTERDMWGMSLVDQMICRIQFRRAAYDGIYTPPTAGQRWIQYPGYNGGTDWGGIAIDPVRGIIVANYNDMPNYNMLVPRETANELGWFPRDDERNPPEGPPHSAGDPQMGAPYAIHVNAGWRMPVTGLLCKEPPYGGIRAIELATGRTIWDRPFGTARRNGPFGIPSLLPFSIGTPNNGGAVVTAGGLAFVAAATDNLIRAIDIETGETVWSDVLPAGGQAGPAVYEQDGKQYLVISAAGHHFMETPRGDWIIAYALPDTRR